MAIIEVENKSNQVVRFQMEEGSEQHDYLRKLLKRDELERVEVVKDAPARKPAAAK
jgi:hypothetical protein